jgi:8-oxo-dGTP pyrophosphatase MutT (NUDIX family)
MGQELRGRIQKRAMVSSLIESVGAFIYCTTTKRYLFVLRNSDKFKGSWGLPGGKVEHNESITNCLLREIEEELGGTIRDAKLIPVEKFTSENGNFVYHTFITPVDSEFVPELNDEHCGYCWVHLKDHPKPLHPGLYRTIKFDAIAQKIKTLEQVL